MTFWRITSKMNKCSIAEWESMMVSCVYVHPKVKKSKGDWLILSQKQNHMWVSSAIYLTIYKLSYMHSFTIKKKSHLKSELRDRLSYIDYWRLIPQDLHSYLKTTLLVKKHYWGFLGRTLWRQCSVFIHQRTYIQAKDDTWE